MQGGGLLSACEACVGLGWRWRRRRSRCRRSSSGDIGDSRLRRARRFGRSCLGCGRRKIIGGRRRRNFVGGRRAGHLRRGWRSRDFGRARSRRREDDDRDDCGDSTTAERNVQTLVGFLDRRKIGGRRALRATVFFPGDGACKRIGLSATASRASGFAARAATAGGCGSQRADCGAASATNCGAGSRRWRALLQRAPERSAPLPKHEPAAPDRRA